jgi:hypothetical protein
MYNASVEVHRPERFHLDEKQFLFQKRAMLLVAM